MRKSQAVLVLEGAEVLLCGGGGPGADRAPFQVEREFLLFQVERAGGIVILCCTTGDAAGAAAGGGGELPAMPPHRLKFQVPFPSPGPELRAKLWRRLLPDTYIYIYIYICREREGDC